VLTLPSIDEKVKVFPVIGHVRQSYKASFFFVKIGIERKKVIFIGIQESTTTVRFCK
jgi:hypothetical protein